MNRTHCSVIMLTSVRAFVALSVIEVGTVEFATAAQIFNNRSTFLTATGPLFSEGFETLPANNSNTLPSVAAADFTVVASNSGLGIFNTSIAGQNATEGTKFLDHQSGAGVTTTFNFHFPIDSFGFDLIDYGDNGSTGQLQLTNSAGDNLVVAMAGAGDGNVRYFGIISTFAFTQAVFTNTIGGEAFAFDRMSYGTRVPEPSILALLVTWALVGAGSTRRIRRL
jgi:hypothetical protein